MYCKLETLGVKYTVRLLTIRFANTAKSQYLRVFGASPLQPTKFRRYLLFFYTLSFFKIFFLLLCLSGYSLADLVSVFATFRRTAKIAGQEFRFLDRFVGRCLDYLRVIVESHVFEHHNG